LVSGVKTLPFTGSEGILEAVKAVPKTMIYKKCNSDIAPPGQLKENVHAVI